MCYFKIEPTTVKSIVQYLNELKPAEQAATLPVPDLSLYLAMRINLGWKYDNLIFEKAVPILSKYQVTPHDPATNYYVGRMMVQLNKETHALWQKQMPAASLVIQEKSGCWPASQEPTFSRLGHNRLESTCLQLMTITLQNRFKNFLKNDRAVDESFPL